MKYKTEWDLSLLYKSEKDPQIEKDIKKLESLSVAFEKKYRKRDVSISSKILLNALKEYTELSDSTLLKPWWYFALRNEKNNDDAIAGAKATQIWTRITEASNKTTFFPLAIGNIPLNKQKKFLNDPLLREYKYLLEKVFDEAKFNLTEKEEQLASLLSTTSYSMWTEGQRRALSQKTVHFKGEDMPLSKASALTPQLPKKERRELYDKVTSIYEENSMFAESELNAIINYKKVMDDLRGFKKPYSSVLLKNENDEKTIEDLVAVVTKYFKLSHRFYSLHAKLLGEKEITRADLMVPIGKININYSFDESVEVIRRIFAKVDKKYSDLLKDFAEGAQFDVYPKKGKSPGGFCWTMGNSPTFILLNHIDDIRSLSTIAHEMGHAIHGTLTKGQPSYYQGNSSATAEVASTFFEQLVLEEITNQLPEEDQIILLHKRTQENILAIFAQIAGFKYETELHGEIRKHGQIDRGQIAAILKKHYESYCGPSVKMPPNAGYNFVSWIHTRLFFYTYTYSYGQLVSRAMYEKWKADPKYAKKIEQFLSAGRSMSPKDIFKSIGINTNEAFFEAGLKGIEADINKLEKLAKKYKKI
ncbi:MAG TPA: M3 family metallopeptidase [Candidatus Paceibacterota bacterium]|jgi:oligoendopeptidase F|nr:M3 family metallopeptidase [Candidatus Paceibacterota bacterium]